MEAEIFLLTLTAALRALSPENRDRLVAAQEAGANQLDVALARAGAVMRRCPLHDIGGDDHLSNFSASIRLLVPQRLRHLRLVGLSRRGPEGQEAAAGPCCQNLSFRGRRPGCGSHCAYYLVERAIGLCAAGPACREVSLAGPFASSTTST